MEWNKAQEIEYIPHDINGNVIDFREPETVKLSELDAVIEMNEESYANYQYIFKHCHHTPGKKRYGLIDFAILLNGKVYLGEYAFVDHEDMKAGELIFKNMPLNIFAEINKEEMKKHLQEISSGKGLALYNQSGLPVVAERKYYLLGKFNKMYVYGQHEHSIIFGGSGSGKTQSLVYPLIKSIIDARENAVIHDCKLELFERFGKQFKDAGYNVIVLNYANPKYSHCWNPYDYPNKLWKGVLKKFKKSPKEFRSLKTMGLSKAIERYKDVAHTLCYEEDNDRNSYFWKGAGNMMAGAALLLAEEGRFDCINGTGIQMIYQMDKQSDTKDKTLKQFLSECRKLDDDSVLQISNYLRADGQTRGNIESTFRQKVEVISSTPDVRYITSKSDFDMEDIFEKQTVVFILTQDEKDLYYPLVTLFLKQLYEVGVELTRQGKYKEWPYKMNWILEEMGVLPEIKNFKNIYNAARSRGLTIYGFMQSMSDMIDKYERTGTNTILENCRVQILLHGETPDTLNYFVDRCDKELYWDKNDPNGPRYKERNLITKARLGTAEKGRILFTMADQHPYLGKLPQYKQYVFYKKPDLTYIRSDEMFGKEGRIYSLDEVHWFSEMEAVTKKSKFINKHRV